MEMQYTVSQLARLAGVTPRTLRYYDSVGLLRPEKVTQSGYRLYGPKEVDRLQLILFYRELGLELSAITKLLRAPDVQRSAVLRQYLQELQTRRNHLDGLIATVKRSIKQEQGGIRMSDIEKFECFKRNVMRCKEEQYGAESRKKYGDQAVDGSNRCILAMTKVEHDAWIALEEEIQERLTAAVRAGLGAESEEGLAIAQAHRRWLSHSWEHYTTQAHVGLAMLYLEDPRFTAYYDQEEPGCACFLRDAIIAYVSNQP